MTTTTLGLEAAFALAIAETDRLGWLGPMLWPAPSGDEWRAAAHAHLGSAVEESMASGPTPARALEALAAVLAELPR